MGVHGLSTYLRENRRTLSSTVQLPRESPSKPTIVVDGWSFIYNVQLSSSLPWVYGGEYGKFAQTVTSIVRAWLGIGLDIAFVFDGPYPPQKFSTLVARGTQQIQSSVLFFRTSASSRAEPRFLRESRIIPPLAYDTCVQTLEELALEVNGLSVHYADEEGDPFAVELAGRLGAYVVGLDSDFVIFNPVDGRYAGYVPFDEMAWTSTAPEEEVAEENDDGFAPVKRSKAKPKPSKGSFGRGIIPPENATDLALSFTVYEPAKLASHLNIPVSLLPLMGALVGNDFSKHSTISHKNMQNMFFDRSLNLSQRIDFVGATLRTVLAAHKQKKKQATGSVIDLVERAVKSLLTRIISLLGTGEIEVITDKIVEATLQYAIPANPSGKGSEKIWSTPVCALHLPDACALLPYLSRLIDVEEGEEGLDKDELQMRAKIRELYVNAYRNGLLSPMLLNLVHTGTFWPRVFLETPDLETPSVTVGREIRFWVYAILNDAVGLPHARLLEAESDTDGLGKDTNTDGRGNAEEEDDDDELIDVVEEDSDDELDDDPLAALQGELELLRISKEQGQELESTPSVSSMMRSVISKPKKVTEYVRRGTRLADELVDVPLLGKLLSSAGVEDDGSSPLILRPEEERFTVLLRAMRSDTEGIRGLSGANLLAVLAVRSVATKVFARATESGGFTKEREAERWSVREGKSFLAALTSLEQLSPDEISDVQLVDQNVQRQAHMLMAIESIVHLVQVLLLTARVSLSIRAYSGKVCQAYLTGQIPIPESVEEMWSICVEGLDGVFLEQKTKKKNKKQTKDVPVAPPKVKGKSAGGLFDLLNAEGA